MVRRLTPHFTLDELTFSQTAVRHGIDNTPTPEIVDNLLRLAERLEEVRNLLGVPILVSSGYRSSELNALIPGASASSAHVVGLARRLRRETPNDPHPVDASTSRTRRAWRRRPADRSLSAAGVFLRARFKTTLGA